MGINGIEKIDIEGGKLTFDQRIELGKIISSGCGQVQALRDVMRCLHDVEVDFGSETQLREYVAYFEEVVSGIAFWIEREKLLKYEPTPEEVQAGINQMSKNIGELGTILAIAQAYSKDPDEILKWEYGKVFGIMYADFEKAKFQRKLNAVYERKNRRGKWRKEAKR
jgi:hypothetical protein